MQVRKQLGLLDTNRMQQINNKLTHEKGAELLSREGDFNRAQERFQKDASQQKHHLDSNTIDNYTRSENTKSVDLISKIQNNPVIRRQKTMDLEI